MVSTYVGLEEESSFGTEAGDGAGSGTPMYFKVLSESMETTREDFFPDTSAYWVVDDGEKAEGFFRAGGDFNLLVDPVQWPKLMVLMFGDGSPTKVGATIAYKHVWLIGANETVAATKIKPFTYFKGTGIEKDRMFEGCLLTGMQFEAVNRQPLTTTFTVLGSGNETLINAKNPTYAAYTQPFMVAHQTATFEIGGADNLTTAPQIEAFRLNINVPFDADHYNLGSRYLSQATLSGKWDITGSMDLSWTSQDEHERFLTAVAGTGTGDQAQFAVNGIWTAATIESTYKYTIEWTMTACFYTGSTASWTARDRIVQTVDFRPTYNATDSCAVKLEITNIATSYTALA